MTENTKKATQKEVVDDESSINEAQNQQTNENG